MPARPTRLQARSWLRRHGRAALLVGVGLAGGGAALAVASVPDTSGVIHGCYNVDASGHPITVGGYFRIIDPSAEQTCNTVSAAGPAREATLDFNQTGPPGAPGVTGSAGVQGPPGTQGSQGSAGPSTPVVQTIALNSVLPTPTHALAHVTATGPKGSLGFDILTVSLGSTLNVGSATGGAGAGKVKFNEFKITKTIDSASPKLFSAAATGSHYSKVTIVVRKAGGTMAPYLNYIFTDVFLSSIQLSGSSGSNENPTESITFNYGTLAVKYVKKK